MHGQNLTAYEGRVIHALAAMSDDQVASYLATAVANVQTAIGAGDVAEEVALWRRHARFAQDEIDSREQWVRVSVALRAGKPLERPVPVSLVKPRLPKITAPDPVTVQAVGEFLAESHGGDLVKYRDFVADRAINDAEAARRDMWRWYAVAAQAEINRRADEAHEVARPCRARPVSLVKHPLVDAGYVACLREWDTDLLLTQHRWDERSRNMCGAGRARAVYGAHAEAARVELARRMALV